MSADKLLLPEISKILELEAFARKDGSGIEFSTLLGTWNFNNVWESKTNDENQIAATFLKVLSANLELSLCKDDPDAFVISNSINFGLISIKFIGKGSLIRKQPLLSFYFENVNINFLNRNIFGRKLKVIEEKKRPFFALIAIDKEYKWLTARGKGGGIALWEKKLS